MHDGRLGQQRVHVVQHLAWLPRAALRMLQAVWPGLGALVRVPLLGALTLVDDLVAVPPWPQLG